MSAFIMTFLFVKKKKMEGKTSPETFEVTLSKYNVDCSEKVISKCNFVFLQSFLNHSKSLCLQNVF